MKCTYHLFSTKDEDKTAGMDRKTSYAIDLEGHPVFTSGSRHRNFYSAYF